MKIAEVLKQQGKDQGIEQGKQDAVKQLAKRLLMRGFNHDEVIDITALSAEEIKILQIVNRYEYLQTVLKYIVYNGNIMGVEEAQQVIDLFAESKGPEKVAMMAIVE
ncbi:MAG: hypothetical protein K5Q00_03585, partial [Gammaproteobacteria bacterium]|nr:hypothetical protein [Gammaproteobacteria bacterium]